MARYDFFRSHSRYAEILYPATEFFSWLASSDPIDAEDSYSESFFRAQVSAGDAEATCLLDYLFVWLTEGRGAAHCATYEHWLITIIGIVDQVRRNRFDTRYPSEHGFVRQKDDIEGSLTFSDDSAPRLSLPILDQEMDLQHPALDRHVFERMRLEWQRRSSSRLPPLFKREEN